MQQQADHAPSQTPHSNQDLVWTTTFDDTKHCCDTAKKQKTSNICCAYEVCVNGCAVALALPVAGDLNLHMQRALDHLACRHQKHEDIAVPMAHVQL